MKTKSSLLLLALLLFQAWSWAQSAQETEVRAAAQQGLQGYLDKIPAGQEARFGFHDRSEFALAQIGMPYQVMTLTQEFMDDASVADKNYIAPTGEWRVAITVNGDNRACLTVAKMNGVTKAVGIGAAGLASDLQMTEMIRARRRMMSNCWTILPASETKVATQGYLLRVFQLDCDFVLGYNADAPQQSILFPLESSKLMLENAKQATKASYDLQETLPLIKTLIANK